MTKGLGADICLGRGNRPGTRCNQGGLLYDAQGEEGYAVVEDADRTWGRHEAMSGLIERSTSLTALKAE